MKQRKILALVASLGLLGVAQAGEPEEEKNVASVEETMDEVVNSAEEAAAEAAKKAEEVAEKAEETVEEAVSE